MTKPAQVRLSFCADLVRCQAPDRYLATLFAPADAREALFALYAFDHEINKVRHIVSQPMTGLIRLQWWREALDAIEAERPPAHPVAEALAAALRGSGLPRRRLDRAIDAREGELEDEPPPDLAALEQHLLATSGGITLAALEILGSTDSAAREVGRRVGLAVGLTDLLRNLDSDLRQGWLRLPATELTRHGIALEPLPRSAASLAPAIALLVEHGLEHLAAARARRQAVPKAALAALLPGSLAGAYLGRLQRAGHDPEAARTRRRSALTPLALLWRSATGRF